MLSQTVLVPDVEVLTLSLTTSTLQGKIEDTLATELEWSLAADLYVTPQDDRRLTIPRHRCIASAEVGGMLLRLDRVTLPAPAVLSSPFVMSRGEDNPNIVATGSQVMFAGAAGFRMYFRAKGPMKSQTELAIGSAYDPRTGEPLPVCEGFELPAVTNVPRIIETLGKSLGTYNIHH